MCTFRYFAEKKLHGGGKGRGVFNPERQNYMRFFKGL